MKKQDRKHEPIWVYDFKDWQLEVSLPLIAVLVIVGAITIATFLFFLADLIIH